MMSELPCIRFQEHRLSNGLQVLLYPDESTPLVHVTLHYRVGSSYEEPGFSGFAHLFEHMMFQGSENLQSNEHGRLVDEAGGNWNASTNKDRTNYYQTLPSNYLDLGLWLEAERMSSLEVTAENFDNQRNTVIEEKKQSYDNRPYGTAFLRFDELVYENWAYSHPVIGDVEDLRKARVEDAQKFHRTHYAPDNAVLVLAGDFSPQEALGKAEEYFGWITHRRKSSRPRLEEPEQASEKRLTMQDPLAVLPAVYLGYHMPTWGSEDHYALSLLSLILTQGESSRLYRDLVYDRNWLGGLSSGPNNYRGPQVFRLTLLAQEGADPGEALKVVLEHLDETCSRHVSEEELEKAKNQYAYRYVSGQAKASGIGEALARHAVYMDDPGAINTQLSRFQAISAEQLMQTARRTFRPENRSLIFVEPKSS